MVCRPAGAEISGSGSRSRRSLRPAPHLRHLRASCRRAGVRPLTVHGHQHRDDRPPLRPPRRRQLPARRLAPRRARARTGRGRRVDTGAQARNAARRHEFQAARKAFAAGGGRSVDVELRSRHDQRCQKGLISRNFAKPSDGLEPSTPSLPWRFRERHARTRAITGDTLSPANRAELDAGDASRDVARVVSDVSVLCPPPVDASTTSSSKGHVWYPWRRPPDPGGSTSAQPASTRSRRAAAVYVPS